MKLLLDTHVFLWAASGDDQMPEQVWDILQAGENQLLVSAASIWEMAVKGSEGHGRLQWNTKRKPEDPESWIERMGADVLPIMPRHAAGTWQLRHWAHKDPFDRMLAAQAIAERATLVTADKALQQLPGLLWFWRQ